MREYVVSASSAPLDFELARLKFQLLLAAANRAAAKTDGGLTRLQEAIDRVNAEHEQTAGNESARVQNILEER